MSTFFYDSLETLQSLTFPKKSDYIHMSIMTVVVICVMGAFIVLLDTVFSGVYTLIADMAMGGASTQVQSGTVSTGNDATIALFSGKQTTGASLTGAQVTTGLSR